MRAAVLASAGMWTSSWSSWMASLIATPASCCQVVSTLQAGLPSRCSQPQYSSADHPEVSFLRWSALGTRFSEGGSNGMRKHSCQPGILTSHAIMIHTPCNWLNNRLFHRY